jgi:hypothetical protein
LEQVELAGLTMQLMVALVQIQPSLAKQLVVEVTEVEQTHLQMEEQVEPLTGMAEELAVLALAEVEIALEILVVMEAELMNQVEAEQALEQMVVLGLETMEEMEETALLVL